MLPSTVRGRPRGPRHAVRRLTSLAAIAAITPLAACSGSGAPVSSATVGAATSAVSPATSATATAPASSTNGLIVADAWAKAVPDLATGSMTAVFASLTNTTDQPIVVASASTDLSRMTELHQTVMQDGAMVMQRVSGGFTIAAHQTRVLKPGGDHIMLMKLSAPLKVGSQLDVVLTTADGATIPLTAVAKTFTEGNEPYASASTHS